MKIVSDILIVIVALLHFYFLYLEMFLWDKPRGMKSFRMTEEQAKQSKTLAMNQGLYNGFLAAGLVWSLLADPTMIVPLRVFFLGCVIVAALVGAATVSPRIFLIQGVPAVVALGLSLVA